MRPALSPILTVAAWEMKGAARSRWVPAAAALYGLCAVAIALVNLRSMSVLGLRGAEAVVDGLVAIGVLVPPLFGVLLGAGAIAGARETGTLQLVAAQPVRRSSLVWGAFLGMTATVWIATGIGLGMVAVVTAPVVTGSDLAALGVAAAATLAAGTAGVALGILISVLAPSRGQATAVAVAAWFLVALGVDVVLVALAPVALSPSGLLVTTLANPLASIRTLGLVATDPALLGPFRVFLDEQVGRATSIVLLGGAVMLWLALPVAVAAEALRRRDV